MISCLSSLIWVLNNIVTLVLHIERENIRLSQNVISQTLKHIQNMSGFNIISNSRGYLALFVPKTLSEVWYFIMDLNLIKIPWFFGFIWVKIHNHLYLYLLPNYLLQTLQIYLDFTWSFPLSKFKLLYSVSVVKHLLRDLLLLLLFYIFKAGNHFVIASLIIN